MNVLQFHFSYSPVLSWVVQCVCMGENFELNTFGYSDKTAKLMINYNCECKDKKPNYNNGSVGCTINPFFFINFLFLYALNKIT